MKNHTFTYPAHLSRTYPGGQKQVNMFKLFIVTPWSISPKLQDTTLAQGNFFLVVKSPFKWHYFLVDLMGLILGLCLVI